MSSLSANLESKLRHWQLASASGDEARARGLSNEVYKIVFTRTEDPGLWDERVLLGLERLFHAHPPDPEVYGEQVQSLLERTHTVRAINSIFSLFLDLEMQLDEVIEVLTIHFHLAEHAQKRLLSNGDLTALRKASISPAAKLLGLVQQISAASRDGPGPELAELYRCVEAVRGREGIGTVNVLLVHKQTNTGVVLPVTAAVQRGSGQVRVVTPADTTLVDAVERARLALVNMGFLAQSQDVVLAANLTEAEYSGGSISLGSAIAIHSAASNRHVDPYTAFTGDINLKDGRWIIQGVEGVGPKLQAALEVGCRRIFLPRDNEPDIPPELQKRLRIVSVADVTEVLQGLLLPLEASRADSLEARKIYLLQATCSERGWHLSSPEPLQDGLQFIISPPHLPEMKVNVYKTGAHSPKRSDRPEFQQVLDALRRLDVHEIPLDTVQKVFTIKDADLRAQIRDALNTISPAEAKSEPYCEYSFRFVEGEERLVVKQYDSGKLQVQGYAGPLYQRVLDVIIPSYNLRYPSAALSAKDYLPVPSAPLGTANEAALPVLPQVVPFPHIGTDESGKGDYFGPIVVAAVWVDEPLQRELKSLGVRDSKTLSDQTCRELAGMVRELCQGKYEEVEIPPDRYNALYDQFKHEKKNLNHLLAWGHARALESLLGRHDSQHAMADQFGDEKYILSRLMEKGKALQLVQAPKAESYVAVAAASILARDRFLQRLEQLGNPFGLVLPKGASPLVVDTARQIVKCAGLEALRKVAKLHFKTTSQVLQRERA